MTTELDSKNIQTLVVVSWSALLGAAFVVVVGFLFVIHCQLDRIERGRLIDDAYNSTVQALEVE